MYCKYYIITTFNISRRYRVTFIFNNNNLLLLSYITDKVYKILNNIQPYNGTIIQNKKIIFENGYEAKLGRCILTFSKYCVNSLRYLNYKEFINNTHGLIQNFKHEDVSGVLNAFISYDIVNQVIIDYLNKHQHLLNIS